MATRYVELDSDQAKAVRTQFSHVHAWHRSQELPLRVLAVLGDDVERSTVGGLLDGWHFDVTPANLPGGERRYEHHERICVENNGPFGGGAVGVPLDHPVISR